jgi:hypothetical protein
VTTRRALILLAALLAVPAAGAAGEWQWSGDIGLGLRYFDQEPQYAGQEDGLEGSLVLNLEAAWSGERSRARFRQFLRLDSADSRRSHFDLREAYWAYEGAGWEVLVGFNKVFWGVTESRHLVDIINQTDLVEDPDQEQKLGQPMVRALLECDWGQLEFYLMPWFRERTFPGEAGRLRPPLAVDTDAAVYESAAKEHHADFALRWSHYFGDVDVGVHAFQGTGREPRLLPAADGTRLVPFYFQTTQAGVDLQYTRDAWLWKLEALARDGLEDRYFAAVAGFEYTFFGLRGGASDLGLLLEYLHDGRGESEPVTVFDDDWFIGARWALNDTQDSSLLAGVVLDSNSSEWFFSLEAQRRLGENYFAEMTVRLFNGDQTGPLQVYDRDDYLELSLARYF